MDKVLLFLMGVGLAEVAAESSWAFLMGVGLAEVAAESSWAPPPKNILGNKFDDYISMWDGIEYYEIHNLNGVDYLHVNNYKLGTRKEIRIIKDKTVPVICDNLDKTVYVVTYNEDKNTTDVMKAYLDWTKKNIVVQNPNSKTNFSVVSGDEKGKITFIDYDKKQGLNQYIRNVTQKLTTDFCENKFIHTYDDTLEGSHSVYSVWKDYVDLYVVLNIVTGDYLMVNQESKDSPLQFYNLETDLNTSDWRTIDFNTGKVRYVRGYPNDTVEFSDIPFTTHKKSGVIKQKIKNLPGTSHSAVKRPELKSYLQLRPHGQPRIIVLDGYWGHYYQTIVESLDNLPVVYDVFAPNTYLASTDGLSKLYKDVKNTYVLQDNRLTKAYVSVSMNKSGELQYARYFGDEKNLKPVVRKFEYSLTTVDDNLNQILTATFTKDSIYQQFTVERDIQRKNIPYVYNHLTFQQMLVVAEGPKLYGLEEPEPGKLVAFDTFTNERKTFTVNADGKVVIQN